MDSPVPGGTPQSSRDAVTFRFIAAPQDASITGEHVAVGSILEWIDKAAYACAVGWSGSYCVTAYVGNVHFTRPIRPGELIEATAQIISTGRTSMQVLVRLASTDIRDQRFQPAMHCLLVFVAIDDEGKHRDVPAWSPRTEAERALRRNALQRVEVRQKIHQEMKDAVFSSAGTAPRVEFRFLALPEVANFGGKVHGGTVMRWIDEAAYACAVRWHKRPVAAVYTGGIHFHAPILIGQVVEIDARLIHTSRDAMHISVRVRAEDAANPSSAKTVTRCVTIFSERDGDAAKPVRSLPLRSDEDISLDRLATTLIDLRATLPRVPH